MIELIFFIFVIYSISKNMKKAQGEVKKFSQKPIINNSNPKNPQNNSQNNHNHAYQHKVEPIQKATVHEERSQRIQEYMKKQEVQQEAREKRAMETNTSSVDGKVNNGMSRGNYKSGKNGDNGEMPKVNEIRLTCGYCGAINILPRSRNQRYSCYFCREDI